MSMENDLEELLRRARMRRMTPEERRVQSISFVYGNANIERDTLARGTVTLSIPSKPKDEKK
jgi:hypothetical protein